MDLSTRNPLLNNLTVTNSSDMTVTLSAAVSSQSGATQQDRNSSQPDTNSLLPGVAMAAKALILLLIFLLSSLGNSAVIVMIIKHRQLRTVTNTFIMSLSLSDLLTALLCVPFSFIMLFTQEGVWIFGDQFCVANGFFNSCFGIISTLTMTLISFDRYYAIVRQPQEKIGIRKATQLLAVVWLTAVLFSFPWYLISQAQGPQVVHKKGFYHCMYIFHSGSSRMGTSYSVAVIIICYLLPFSLMCFCHYNICKTVRLSEIRVRPVTTYAHLLRFYSEMRTATTVLIMIVFIICCWGPYCVMGIITAAGDLHFTPFMDTVSIWLAWANGALNPLIYVTRNPNISMLLGRNREDGYRTRNIAAYLSSQSHEARIRDRYVNRQGASSRMSSSSPANGDVAMWACKNPAVLFCRDGQPDPVSELTAPKSETRDTSL
ncbi:G-protein coupled receptor 135 [Heterodontus francisci]|uniref:G-protein coupled receptor 135 n=1 Tax=Heterodontus francisci TaxID=7792 RepID=UPI00355AD003